MTIDRLHDEFSEEKLISILREIFILKAFNIANYWDYSIQDVKGPERPMNRETGK